MHRVPILVMVIAIMTTGCSTMRESLTLGISTGAATGAVAGASLNKNSGKGALQGALVGGAISGIASYFIHKGLKKRDQKTRRETLFNLDKFGIDYPKNYSTGNGPGLSMPVVESEWVDTQVKGKKLVEGHRVWIISEEPQWIPNSELKKEKK
ncbi:hypothetical protein [Halobacteriovorax sp. HLS]|uniref:hypothetical protein n=1 Tax=Halobacteriovorax sp. HLS TaxID=2234000 RepID=UPI000FD93971|nr:hypothetical protein [Halobacteriovorax sp. HLS]